MGHESEQELKREIKLRKPNVLAVDDYPANLVALQAVLGQEYNLINAHSGTEAISILISRHDIDVILMDIQMPGMDGFEATTEIKKIKGAEDIPIIFITAVYKEDPFVKKGYAAGGVDYFSKPFDPDILKLKLGIYASFRQRSDTLKERERQVNETEELLRVGRKLSNVLEDLPVGVLISDVEGRICQVNIQAAQLCKAGTPPELDSFSQMLGWWDSKGHILKEKNAPLHRTLQTGKPCESEEIELHCDDGAKKRILSSASPLLGLDGHTVGAVVVLQDITETKRLEQDLKNRITRLVSAGVELEESL
jgi:CheY-like chemotaxis protein